MLYTVCEGRGGCHRTGIAQFSTTVLASDYSTELWTETFVAPPRASRFSDLSSPADSFSQTLVEQLRKDGVVR